MTDRAGKTFVVTGGASGLGEATCRLFASQGANIAILDRDEERGVAIAKELGPRAAFFSMDATKEESVKAAIDAAHAKFGNIRGLVTCAGVGSATTTISKKHGVHNTDIWDFVLAVNLTGVFNAVKYCAEKMSENEDDGNGRGVIINCASVAAVDGQKGQVAYAASKGGYVLRLARLPGRTHACGKQGAWNTTRRATLPCLRVGE